MLISHHPPCQYDRTYRLGKVRICARCSGIPIGLLILASGLPNPPAFLLCFFPLPAFMQFLFQELHEAQGHNLTKSILSIPLGIFLGIMMERMWDGAWFSCILMLAYLIIIEFIVASILYRNGQLEKLISRYEKGIFTHP